MRVQILKDFVKQHFSSTQLLDYALEVEKITTSKVRFIFLLLPVLANAMVVIMSQRCFLTNVTFLSCFRNPT